MREIVHLEDTGISGMIILRSVFGKCDVGGMEWIDLAQDRRQVVGAREGGNELSGSIKCEEFLDWLRKCLLIRTLVRNSSPVRKGQTIIRASLASCNLTCSVDSWSNSHSYGY